MIQKVLQQVSDVNVANWDVNLVSHFWSFCLQADQNNLGELFYPVSCCNGTDSQMIVFMCRGNISYFGVLQDNRLEK